MVSLFNLILSLVFLPIEFALGIFWWMLGLVGL